MNHTTRGSLSNACLIEDGSEAHALSTRHMPARHTLLPPPAPPAAYCSSYSAASSKPESLRKGAVCICRRRPRATRIFSSGVFVDGAEIMPRVTSALINDGLFR